MTRLGGLLACLFLLLLAAPGASTAQRRDDERMLRYVVAADVRPDGTVAVTEQVRYHFTKPRHGFFRFLPLHYPLVRQDGSIDAYDARKLEIDNYTATMDGQPVPFVRDEETSGANENFVLRIGDEHNANVTGDHDYRFSYEIRGLLNAPGGRPELFWNALGKDSRVPVDHAEVTVTAPGTIDRVRCVVGTGRRDKPCATAEIDGTTAQFAADDIDAYQAVTVTVALPDTVSVPPPIVRAKASYVGSLRDNLVNPGREAGIPGLAVALTIIGFVLGAGLVVGLVAVRGGDRYFAGITPGLLPAKGTLPTEKRRFFAQRRPAAVRFDAPKGVPPPLCGVILRKKADKSVLAAALTDLAVRGHVTITEVDSGFKVKPASGDKRKPSAHDRVILDALPAKGVTLTGRTTVASTAFRRAMGRLRDQVFADALGRTWFRRDPSENKFRAIGGVLLFLSLWPLVLLAERGLLWWWVPFALTTITLMVLPARWRTGRTAVGAAVLSQVLDFRCYIETAEAEQIAEEERRAIFNRYLPYAQVFGLAERWTQKFAKVGAAVPDGWYVGTAFSGSATDASFATSYSSFTSTVDSSVGSSGSTLSFSSDTSSSSGWSGGSSGFSDSGSSSSGGGDGGGGGGGGSW